MDKYLLEGLLWDTKVLSDLCLHGTIESSTPEVHSLFESSLKDILTMQNEIYKKMEENGFYQVTQVEKTKIMETKSKFDATCDCEPFCTCEDEEDE